MKSLFYRIASAACALLTLNAQADVAQFLDNSGQQIVNTTFAEAYQWDSVDVASPIIELQDNSKLVVSRAGVYQITYAINWRTDDPTGTNARRQIRTFVRKNGEALAMAQSHGYARIEHQAENATNAATFFVELSVGDYLELYHINESSNTGDAISNPGQSWFSLALFKEVDTAQQQLGEGLVAYLPFNGNASDESSYGNHGNVIGATLTQDRFGNPDSAYQFDGVDDYIAIANAPSLNPTTQITLSGWYRVDSRFRGNGGNSIINKSYNLAHSAPYYQYNLQVTGHDYPSIPGSPGVIAVTSSGTNYAVALSMLTIGQWIHIVGVYDGVLVKIYVNGTLISSATHGGTFSDFGQDVWIGRNSASVGQYTPGFIDDLRIYNRALSDAEIQSLYNLESTSN